ncbi:endonuclease domain-containing protein [Brachybacterium sp. GCM10030252]|uniref:endonuclease domain-containing protein n=1 Tax=Brachybacterium sp. GCM10030252 TaxID=3273380 RepID=UPI00360B17C9
MRALRRRGFHVEQQVFVEGAGYVDAYVAGVFLEIDGRAHHSSPEAFEADRQRDLAVRRHGLQLIRLSYAQTWRTWEHTLKALLETIEQVGPLGRRKVAQLI